MSVAPDHPAMTAAPDDPATPVAQDDPATPVAQDDPAATPARRVAVLPIRAYQVLISPMLGERCKYYPSCSEYAVQAVTRFGILRGLVLAGWRLLRCNPWSRGGYDPVEEQRLFKAHPTVTSV